jgi:hypothetical protein
MKDKKKRYWLRGGIIGLIIGLFLIINPFPFIRFLGIFSELVYYISFGFVYNLMNINQEEYLFYILIFHFIVFFIYGVIIGGIYGKIKNRKK